MRPGANYLGDGKCEFVVWAPLPGDVKLKIYSPEERLLSLKRADGGYWQGIFDNVFPGTLYKYLLDGEKERADPVSNLQPQGVHGPSQVIDQNSFKWDDECWRGIDISELLIYELHVGTFSQAGTFDGIINHLDYLVELGVNSIEIMPIAQFPGSRNWGYDGVYLYAVQNSYGGPEALKRMVNACHNKGISVILDVVYNHLGPEGNYLWDYGAYFTQKHKTPWGEGMNFDDNLSDAVRDFFIGNALYWLREYHIDALRLDAIHSIFDSSAKHILSEISEKTEELSRIEGRRFYLIAESDLNDRKVINPKELGGYGIDSQWCDDFHHALHTLVTGEERGYYIDYGAIGDMVKAFKEGFVFTGEYSQFRQRKHGDYTLGSRASAFVVFSQNHDQVGNRMPGDRLSHLVSFEALKLIAGAVILSPYIPFLFMGEEYGEDAPFLYFVSHSDPGLIESVREGRKAEFKSFNWKGETPDPQDEETFKKSILNLEKRKSGDHAILLSFYKKLIALRKEMKALSNCNRDKLEVYGFEDERIIFLLRWEEENYVLSIFNFNTKIVKTKVHLPVYKVHKYDEQIKKKERWLKILDSSDSAWGGEGALLPPYVSTGDEVSMRESSVAVYSLVLDN